MTASNRSDMSKQSNVFAYVGSFDLFGGAPPMAGPAHGGPPMGGPPVGGPPKVSPKDSIQIFQLDSASGALKALKTAIPEVVVGSTYIDVKRNILYLTDEKPRPEGVGGGLVYACAIDPTSGDLTVINRKPSYGVHPSYCAMDASGEYLLVTHHTGRGEATRTVGDASTGYRLMLEYEQANLVLFRLGKDGSIGEPCDIYTATGDGGPLPQQTHPQLHSVTMSPSGKLFAVCDKGNDRIFMFAIDRGASKLQLRQAYAAIPGSSPRYHAFHPRRPFLFVNYETKALVSSFRYSDDGTLEAISTVDSLPDGVNDGPDMLQTDLKVHPSGKYLYNLIRGLNTVSVFAIDEDSGTIEKIQTVTIEGKGPRGCAISPDGRFLLVAGRMSNDVVSWAIGDDGKLSPTGFRVESTTPGNVTFFAPTD